MSRDTQRQDPVPLIHGVPACGAGTTVVRMFGYKANHGTMEPRRPSGRLGHSSVTRHGESRAVLHVSEKHGENVVLTQASPADEMWFVG